MSLILNVILPEFAGPLYFFFSSAFLALPYINVVSMIVNIFAVQFARFSPQIITGLDAGLDWKI